MGLPLTAIELIAKERSEQISKHGYTPERDQIYQSGELLDVIEGLIRQDYKKFPGNWPVELVTKMLGKPMLERLVYAGAFIAAEIDRRLWSVNETILLNKLKEENVRDINS